MVAAARGKEATRVVGGSPIQGPYSRKSPGSDAPRLVDGITKTRHY